MLNVNCISNKVGLRILIQYFYLACSLNFSESTSKLDCFVIPFYFVTFDPMPFDMVRMYEYSHDLGKLFKLKGFLVIVRYERIIGCIHTCLCIESHAPEGHNIESWHIILCTQVNYPVYIGVYHSHNLIYLCTENIP